MWKKYFYGLSCSYTIVIIRTTFVLAMVCWGQTTCDLEDPLWDFLKVKSSNQGWGENWFQASALGKVKFNPHTHMHLCNFLRSNYHHQTPPPRPNQGFSRRQKTCTGPVCFLQWNSGDLRGRREIGVQKTVVLHPLVLLHCASSSPYCFLALTNRLGDQILCSLTLNLHDFESLIQVYCTL